MIHESLRRRLARKPVSSSIDLRHELRPVPGLLAQVVHHVRTADEAVEMVGQLSRLSLRRIGLDSEFRAGPATEEPDDGVRWQDVSQLHPISIGIAAIAVDGTAERAIQFCVDVRSPAPLAGLRDVLNLPVTFVVHHMKSEYMALRALGLPWPTAYFDTWLAKHLLMLGRHHAKYEDPDPQDEVAEITATESAKQTRRGAAALVQTATEYGIEYPFHGDKDEMRARYLSLPDAEPLDEEDAAYVCADALTAARLHVPMRMALLDAGLDYHYDLFELPASVEFAEMERLGIRVEGRLIELAGEAALAAIIAYESKLAPAGFRTERATARQIAASARPTRVMVTSYDERVRVLGRLGLLHLFRSNKATRGYSFAKKMLKQHREVHPVINLLYLHGKYTSIVKDKLFAGQYIGADGRVHPYIHPLGADSGRVSTKRPNLLGIGKILRPIVLPDGIDDAIVELDFTQQEIVVAAEVFDDDVLMADCNNGDVYCAMVRRFCRRDLDPGDVDLDDKSLAAKYGELRDRWKIITLAIIYGMTNDSVVAAAKLSSRAEAEELRRQFFGRYWKLGQGIGRAVRQLQDRGFAQTVTGMKRYRGKIGRLTHWERRWAVNAPVQGGGACILKLVLPRVARYLRMHRGRVLLTVHDALVIQVPKDLQPQLVDGVKALMIDGLRELYPAAQPRVGVNDADTSCWNYKGFSDSIERFADDPEFNFKALGPHRKSASNALPVRSTTASGAAT